MKLHTRLELLAMVLGAVWCLTACETIAEHPYITATAVAFAAGSIAASQPHDNRVSPTDHIGRPVCSAGAC
jgi:hypothetical protein